MTALRTSFRRDRGKPHERNIRWFPRVGDTVITTPFTEPEFGLLTRLETVAEVTYEEGCLTSSGRRFERAGANWVSDLSTSTVAGDRTLLMLPATEENKKLYEESRYSAEKRFFIQSMDWELLMKQLTEWDVHLLFTTLKQIENLRNNRPGSQDFPRLVALPEGRTPVTAPTVAPILALPVQWFYFKVAQLPELVPNDAAYVVRTDAGHFMVVSAIDPDEDNPTIRTLVLRERVVHGWITAGILSAGVDTPEPKLNRKCLIKNEDPEI